jgi:hypothetical protein
MEIWLLQEGPGEGRPRCGLSIGLVIGCTDANADSCLLLLFQYILHRLICERLCIDDDILFRRS